jgi:hypothetical protein
MSNPARALHDLLTGWEVPPGQSVANARGIDDERDLEAWMRQGAAVDLVRQIEFLLVGMGGVGAEISPYRKALPRWFAACFSFANGWTEGQVHGRPAAAELDLDLLLALSSQLDTMGESPVLTAPQLKDLSEVLVVAEAVARDAADLPHEVRRYVLALIVEARAAISELDTFGAVALRRISVELGGALVVAAGSVPESSDARSNLMDVSRRLLFYIGTATYPAIAMAVMAHEIGPGH